MEPDPLVDTLTYRLGSRRLALDALDAFAGAIVAEVAAGGRVALTGFGVFDSSGVSGARGAVPRFRPGSTFRDAVAPGPHRRTGSQSPQPSATKPRHSADAGKHRSRTTADSAPPAKTPALRFNHYELPAGVSLSAVLPQGAGRCGIYVLHFDDEHRYVGQAHDVLVRFSTHRRRWGDRIVALDFAPAAAGDLNTLEQRTIQHLEGQGIGLFNSALVGLPMGESPLDVVVDRVEQEQWLDKRAEEDYDLIERLALAASRPRTGKGFEELTHRADFPGICLGLLEYLLKIVPWPHETERRFWSVTSMPSTGRTRSHHRLSVVSVNNVETLVVAEELETDGWVLWGFLNVSPGLADPDGWPMERRIYGTVGVVDQITFVGVGELLDLLEMPDVVVAGRRLAMGLMRKGRGMMGKYHDDSLADEVFATLGDLDSDGGVEHIATGVTSPRRYPHP